MLDQQVTRVDHRSVFLFVVDTINGGIGRRMGSLALEVVVGWKGDR